MYPKTVMHKEVIRMSEQEKAKVTEMIKKITALPKAAQQQILSGASIIADLTDDFDIVPKGKANADQGTDKSG